MTSDIFAKYNSLPAPERYRQLLEARNQISPAAWEEHLRDPGLAAYVAGREKGGAQRALTKAEWEAEGKARFGADMMSWRFRCPVCGHVATPQDWKDVGARETAVAFSCVGRWMKDARKAFSHERGSPCDYAGGGLFGLNPITVIEEGGVEHRVFDFAPELPSPPASPKGDGE